MAVSNSCRSLAFGMFLVSGLLSFGQDVGGSTGTTSPTATAGPNTRTVSSGSPTDALNQRRQQEVRRPVMLAGNVITQTGEPPTESVRIERLCGGQTFAEGYTDSKGRFSFTIGQNNAVFGDASTSGTGNDLSGSTSRSISSPSLTPGQTGGVTERELWGCEIRANLAGYTSQTIPLSGRRMLDNPDIGIIMIRKLGVTEGRVVSITTLQAPKEAKKAFEKGTKLASKGKFVDAEPEFRKAVELYPEFAMAHYELARLHLREKREDAATKELDLAIKADNKLEQPYVLLSSLALEKQDWALAKTHAETLLKLNPFDYPRAYMMSSVAQLQLREFESAVTTARRGLKQDFNKTLPQLHHILGLALAQHNDLPGAAQELKLYLAQAPASASNIDLVKTQLSQVEKALEDQRLAKKEE